eukprot:5687288-Prymnesium_polylepis.1
MSGGHASLQQMTARIDALIGAYKSEPRSLPNTRAAETPILSRAAKLPERKSTRGGIENVEPRPSPSPSP